MRTLRNSLLTAARHGSERRGVILVFMVIGILMLLAMTMISVEIASMQLARTELRAASDAAAKAGAEALLRTQSESQAIQAALAMAELNTVAGQPFKLKSSDVLVGTSTQQTDGTWAFASGGSQPNSVRINSSMSATSASGPVKLTFGKAFGAGTFTPTQTSTASVTQQEICLAIDRSASMSFNLQGIDWVYPPAGDYDRRPKTGSRWKSLDKALKVYLQEIKQSPVPSRVSLVTWASDMSGYKLPKEDNLGELLPITSALASITTRLEAALSYNFGTIESKMAQLGEHPIYGGTNMAAGIDKAVDTLTASNVLPFARKVVVLMTDGQWNQGRDPIEAAEEARQAGITIHVVTFLPEAQTADAKAIADLTKGTYIHANNEDELIAAFEKLARTLPVVLTD